MQFLEIFTQYSAVRPYHSLLVYVYQCIFIKLLVLVFSSIVRPIVYCVYITVVECPAIPTWLNVIPDSSDWRYLSSIQYSCAPGYRFTHQAVNSSTQNSTCNVRGEWQPSLQSCSRKLRLLVVTNYVIYNCILLA